MGTRSEKSQEVKINLEKHPEIPGKANGLPTFCSLFRLSDTG